MAEQTDHDILIEVRTTLGHLVQTQTQYLEQYGKLLERVVTLEIERNRNSTKIESLEEDIDDLRNRSNIIDAINALGTTIAGIIGYIFGQR